MPTESPTNGKPTSELAQLLEDKQYLVVPKVGDVVRGIVVSAGKNEVHLDLGGYSGIVRGLGLYNESSEYANLVIGDEVEATVIDVDNELGQLELSFRYAGHQKSWDELTNLRDSNETVDVTVMDANKGGLIVKLNHVEGFLPVSQLNAEHYPRVPGGDKLKIQEKLKSFVGEKLKVRVLDADLNEEKLIVSEKKIEEDQVVEQVSAHKVGEECEGPITAIADFGAFVQFAEGLTGLIHISELAWQRVENPSEVVKVGDVVKAQIININGPKVFLSRKRLLPDPWKTVGDRYPVGAKVTGTVRKVNSFGLFVELDPEIHGLAHVSELGLKQGEQLTEKHSVGDELEFTVISLKPAEYRLGLSLVKTPEDMKKAAEGSTKQEAKEAVQDKEATHTSPSDSAEATTDKETTRTSSETTQGTAQGDSSSDEPKEEPTKEDEKINE